MEALEMKKDMILPVAAPEIREREAFRVVGLSARCSCEDISGIPGLWQAFNAREDDVADAVHGVAYGVCCDADGTGRFRYLAGVEASSAPQGMDVVNLPKARYAVFTHCGHVADLPKTVYTIWNKALPDAALTPASAPDFERYDERFDVESGRGIIEVWIPVEVVPGK
jgi:AraC family transcriptional regulator